MIECRNIVKEYRRGFWQRKAERVLSGISLSLHDGETYAVCGLSGSGKSTLGRVLLGLIPATGGEIFYDGKELQEILRVPSERKEFRRRHQILFQDPQGSLYPDFSIRRLMEEPYRVHRSDLGAPDWTRIDECLRRVRLDGNARSSGARSRHLCAARLWIAIRRSSPADSSSACAWRGFFSCARRFSFSMSRRRCSIRRRRRESFAC